MEKETLNKIFAATIILFFFGSMFIYMFSNSPPPQEEQNQNPTPTPQTEFIGNGLAQAKVLSLTDKLYIKCTSHENLSTTQIQQAILQATNTTPTRETQDLYSLTLNTEQQNPETLLDTTSKINEKLNCQNGAIILRDGFIEITHGSSCTNPQQDLENPEYENKAELFDQTGQCKNMTFSDLGYYTRLNPQGISAFLQWHTQQNTTITTRINAKLYGKRVVQILAEELSPAPTEPSTPEEENNSTKNLNQTTEDETLTENNQTNTTSQETPNAENTTQQ